MNFSDIFKNSFLNSFASVDVSMRQVVVMTFICCLFAFYMFLVYRLVTRKTFYDKNMNISVAVISVIVCAIILTIQSSIVVSLGMVGALSIVRFRTAIKNPMDLIFLFWSISVGIICGAGLPAIAAVLSFAVTGGILILDRLPVSRAPMLLIVNASDPAVRQQVLDVVRAQCPACAVKSQTIEPGRLSMVIEVRVREDSQLIAGVSAISSVTRTSLISHDGEVTF